MKSTEVIEKAKIISNMLNFNQNNSEESKSFLDNEKIVNLMKDINKSENHASSKDKFAHKQNNFEVIKTILPHLGIENNENLDFIINFMDINSIVKGYKSKIQNTDSKDKMHIKKEAILSVKNKLSESNKVFVELILKFMELNEIINIINIRKEGTEND